LTANATAMSPVATSIRANGQSYSVFTNYRYFYDLVDICNRIEASGVAPAGVLTASQNVRAAVNNTLTYEGHNANSSGSHGLAIDLSPPSFVGTMMTDYRKMQFATATHWDEWLVAQQ
ncbi:MAG: hypothetical protein ABUL72_05585, partial [Armatimonadota bacterium]